MPLIKSPDADLRVVPLSLRDVEAEAREMVSCARQEAERSLEEAQRQAERVRQAAHEDGFARGHAEGFAAGIAEGQKAGAEQALFEQRERLTQLLLTLNSIATELESNRDQLEAASVREVTQLALAIARRVTKLQAQRDPLVLEENLAEALKLVLHAADIRIAVHPDQRQMLSQILPRLQMRLPSLQHVQLLDDPSIAIGGCRIFTRGGSVDADLNTQLDRIAADLMPQQRESAHVTA